ncbi:hypothetical protein Selin_0666 [Desulfurispirillum indicum S5]|uniref:Uncharacterized protein n=1 Tax=Desulfurispirillum indicum (strain ATCC BAA-1389 / DSM 22839 / S5) TaxID=653733 RepID=E6W1F5_DESIS|nr:hypothetical protein Selin_0666 [Desulfurispirillum indicum S5]
MDAEEEFHATAAELIISPTGQVDHLVFEWNHEWGKGRQGFKRHYEPRMNANMHKWGKFHAKTVGRGNRKSLTTEITEDTEVTANRRE